METSYSIISNFKIKFVGKKKSYPTRVTKILRPLDGERLQLQYYTDWLHSICVSAIPKVLKANCRMLLKSSANLIYRMQPYLKNATQLETWNQYYPAMISCNVDLFIYFLIYMNRLKLFRMFESHYEIGKSDLNTYILCISDITWCLSLIPYQLL